MSAGFVSGGGFRDVGAFGFIGGAGFAGYLSGCGFLANSGSDFRSAGAFDFRGCDFSANICGDGVAGAFDFSSGDCRGDDAFDFRGVDFRSAGAAARGTGISGEAFRLIKEVCRAKGIFAIRVDTQAENKVMRHILEREGFEYCGLIQFDGGAKLAYELDF